MTVLFRTTSHLPNGSYWPRSDDHHLREQGKPAGRKVRKFKSSPERCDERAYSELLQFPPANL